MPDVFTIDGTAHEVGNESCRACVRWKGYPDRHEDCGGLMHGQFYDESYDHESGEETTYLHFLCDQCSEDDPW